MLRNSIHIPLILLVFLLSFCTMNAQINISDEFWASSTNPNYPIINGTSAQMTFLSLNRLPQSSFLFSKKPINIQRDFQIEFTLNFGNIGNPGGDGIAFSLWMPDSIFYRLLKNNYCSDSLYKKLKKSVLKNTGGCLGSYYLFVDTVLPPILTFDFDLVVQDGDTAYISRGKNFFSMHYGGHVYNYFYTPTSMVNFYGMINDSIRRKDGVVDSNDYRVCIKWKSKEKVFNVNIDQITNRPYLHYILDNNMRLDSTEVFLVPGMIDTLYRKKKRIVTQPVNIEAIKSLLSTPFYKSFRFPASSSFVYLGFTSTTGYQQANQVIKDIVITRDKYPDGWESNNIEGY